MEPKKKFSLAYALTRAARQLNAGTEQILEWRDVEAIEFAVYKIEKWARTRQDFKGRSTEEIRDIESGVRFKVED